MCLILLNIDLIKSSISYARIHFSQALENAFEFGIRNLIQDHKIYCDYIYIFLNANLDRPYLIKISGWSPCGSDTKGLAFKGKFIKLFEDSRFSFYLFFMELFFS